MMWKGIHVPYTIFVYLISRFNSRCEGSPRLHEVMAKCSQQKPSLSIIRDKWAFLVTLLEDTNRISLLYRHAFRALGLEA